MCKMAWDPKDDIFKRFAITPDRELLLWEDWIKIRKEEVTNLGKNLMRPPIDLVMNKLEGVRQNKEEKKVLEEAQLSKKLRLGIEDCLWEQAPRFRQRCRCDNVYEAVRTPAAIGRPKVIQHIGCPHYVQKKEKGLIGEPERVVCHKLNAEYEKYKAQRTEELHEKIKKIDPFTSEIAELIVIGRKPQPPPKKPPPVPLIQISETSDLCVSAFCGIYALRINNSIFVKEIPNQTLPYLKKLRKQPANEKCKSWTYYFNSPEQKICRSSLYLENLGTVSIRYCWKKKRIMVPFIPEAVDENKFFFYKNEDVISPGQKKTLYFTFVSEKPGIFAECWEFSTLNICLFDTSAERLLINLIGDAIENMTKVTRKITKLENRIHIKVLSKFVLDLINDMITRATTVEPQVYIYPYKNMLLEAELFIAKNPVCYYHQSEVNTLKDMYKTMTGDEWDLSIASWREAILVKDFEERISYFESLKKSFSVCLKPWYDRRQVAKEKYRGVYTLLGKLADKFSLEHDRVREWNGVPVLDVESDSTKKLVPPIKECQITPDIVRNIFYIRMYEHVIDTIETCAGLLSSLDLNRWIEFDFCQI